MFFLRRVLKMLLGLITAATNKKGKLKNIHAIKKNHKGYE